MKRLAMLLPLILMVACQNGRTQPKGESGTQESAAAEADNSKYYSVALNPAEIAPGAKTDVAVVITPASGYKWNDEYPAKFKVEPPDGVKVEKIEYKQMKKEVEIGKAEARLVLPVTLADAGIFELQVKANFSVCNDTSCKIMRKELFKLPLTGK
jgi:hypothetical protein